MKLELGICFFIAGKASTGGVIVSRYQCASKAKKLTLNIGLTQITCKLAGPTSLFQGKWPSLMVAC